MHVDWGCEVKRLLVGLLLALLLACGAHDSAESVSTSAAGLELPTGDPVPKGWTGSTVQLLVADAWASCSYYATDLLVEPASVDASLQTILTKMTELATPAVCSSATSPNPLEAWVQLRAAEKCNTRGGNDARLALPQVILPGTWTANLKLDQDADPIVRFPAQNICIAQKLRAASPGAAGISTLTLGPNEQRELLEVVRERATLALLGYAKLYELGRSANPISATTVAQRARQALEDTLIGAGVSGGLMAAVQLVTIATEDVLELFARSASARVPRSSKVQDSIAADTWGPGGWRSRALAVLYGGEPLAATSSDVPPWPPLPPGGSLKAPPPFISEDVRDPRVDELRIYVDRYDAFNLKMLPLPSQVGCHDVDLEPSVSRMVRQVEAGLRTDGCTNLVSNTCIPVPLSAVPDPALGVGDFLLWKDHRIGLDVARSLARQMSQQIGRSCIGDGLVSYETPGGMTPAGVETILSVSGEGPLDGDYYHVAKGTTFASHEPLAEWVSRNVAEDTRGGLMTLAGGVYLDEDSSLQGLPATSLDLEDRRLAGSMNALEATRHVVLQALTSSSLPTAFGSGAKPALAAIEAAIGTTGLTMEPLLENQGSGLVLSDVVFTLYAPQDDDFWAAPDMANLALVVIDDDTFTAKANDLLIPQLLGDPTFRSFTNVTLADRLTHSVVMSAQSVTPRPASKTPLNEWSFNAYIPTLEDGFVLARKTTSTGTSYRLLAGPVGVNFLGGGFPIGFHFAYGGSLGDRASQLIQVQKENPSQPFFDAFGYPVKMYPPSDPYLSGNTNGAATTKLYLDNASKAADAAVGAVTIAYQALLEKAKEDVDASAQIARSTQVLDAARRQLCGDKKPDCGSTVKVVEQELIRGDNRNKFNGVANDCNTPSQEPGFNQLACVARLGMSKYDVRVNIASVVKAALDGGDPTFADYAGGTLQGVFIEQYASFRRMEDQFTEYETAYQVAKARVNAANQALSGASQRVDSNCGPGAIAEAIVAGISGGFASVSVSLGPVIALAQKCRDLETEIGPAKAQAVLSLIQGIDDMQQTYMRMADAGKAVGLAVAAGSAAIQEAKLAEERANLDKELATSVTLSNSPTFRQFHDYDVWRARALVENARRYAILARRAIEARYVVDLTTMQGQEPFVAPPTGWADQIYEYDMNMPAAVGLTLGGQQATGSVYPNVVVDYVGNLQRFVDGYAIKRPSAATLADSEVISLPGPAGAGLGGQLPQGVINSEAYRWTFFCPSTKTWASIPSSGDVDHPCGLSERPTFARLRFDLDPWGRLKGSINDEPYAKRYNVRWSKLVLNLVGTGIKDCTKASDPLTCYAQPFLRYDMTHVGPSWATNFEQTWVALEVPRGQIEGAKALAAEQWLDPLSNSWSKPYVAQVARTEYLDRPVAGAYLATFTVGPEVTISRIDRIQVLAESAYWVKQQ